MIRIVTSPHSAPPARRLAPTFERLIATASCLALVAFSTPALSQAKPDAAPTRSAPDTPASPAPEGPRFSFSPTEKGVLRLDSHTGIVSLCATSPSGYACALVPDDRDNYEGEIARLKAELATLQARLDAALKRELEDENLSGEQPAHPDDIGAAFDYAERTLRWLRGIMTDKPPQPEEERL